MNVRRVVLIFLVILCCAFPVLFLSGCSEDEDPTGPENTPTPAPPTATPTQPPVPPGGGYIKGYAVVNVTGAGIAPYDEADKGILFSIDGPHCESAWVRLRNVDGTAKYQSKAVGNNQWEDPCWGETHYYSTQPSADGDWKVVWWYEGGDSFIRFECPNGTSETISVYYKMAFDRCSPNATGCAFPVVNGNTQATIKEFVGEEVGENEVCYW